MLDKLHSTYRFLCLLPVIFFIHQPVSAQNEIFIAAQTDNQVTFMMKNLDALEPTGPGTAAYRPFWIFGDGSFLRDPNTMTDASPSGTTYNYGRQGSFLATVYLTERYSNNEPPSFTVPTSVGINTAILSTPTGQIQQVVNSPSKLIGMDTSQCNRPEHETVYVIGSNPLQSEAEELLFFYGAKISGTGIASDDPAFSYKRAHKADYSTGAVIRKSTTDFDAAGGTSFSTQFDSVAIYSFTASDWSYLASKEGAFEHRIFHVLKTEGKQFAQIGDMYRTLALLVGQNAGLPIGPEVAPLLNAGTANGLVVQDAVWMDAPICRAHDPNILELTNICQCPDGCYELTYELTFCNDGNATSTSMSFQLTDSLGLFSDCWAVELERPSGCTVPALVQSGTAGVWSVDKFTCGLEPQSIHDPSLACGKLIIRAQTDGNGKKAWTDPYLATFLKACVVLDGSPEECARHAIEIDSLPYPAVWLNRNNRCDPGCLNCGVTWPWWWYVLAVAAVAGIAYFFRRK